MDNLKYLMSKSILGRDTVKPFTSEIAKSFTGLTFFDSLPRDLPDSNKFGITYIYDEVMVFDVNGNDIGTDGMPRKLIKCIGKLRDNIVVFGFMSGGKFVGADAYQREQIYGRQGHGWLSATFTPAYFTWVLGIETLLRYAVFRDGVADLPKQRIIHDFTGSSGYVIVRASAEGIVEGDDRAIFAIDGIEGYD